MQIIVNYACARLLLLTFLLSAFSQNEKYFCQYFLFLPDCVLFFFGTSLLRVSPEGISAVIVAGIRGVAALLCSWSGFSMEYHPFSAELLDKIMLFILIILFFELSLHKINCALCQLKQASVVFGLHCFCVR